MNDTMMSKDDSEISIVKKYLPKRTKEIESRAHAISCRTSISVSHHSDIAVEEVFWESGDQMNRSWLFALHSFQIFDILLSAENWTTVRDLMSEWIEAFSNPETDELGQFPWHDHATALRLDRLSVMRLLKQDLDYPELALEHARLLLTEDFYSEHTNHGFDQAMSLLLASYAFRDALDTSDWLEVGLTRLINEVQFAFNEEGVHVENSPAYHVGMTANLVRARFLLNATGATLGTDFDFEDLLNKALLFTTWMIGPDRRLAMLGDSTYRGGYPPDELSNLPNYQHVLYAASNGKNGKRPKGKTKLYPHAGYGIYRSDWAANSKATHLVMKCGFLSQYHRQDDDLNILLQAKGEHWLIDSGLYNHNSDHPVRKYMRSAFAHNVPLIKGRNVSRVLPAGDKKSTLSGLEVDGAEAAFVGTTQIYRDARLKRTVVVKDMNNIQVTDEIERSANGPRAFILFHVPKNKIISVAGDSALIQSNTEKLEIRVTEGSVGRCKVFSGLDADFPSVQSEKIDEYQPTQVIVFGPLNGSTISFSLQFSVLNGFVLELKRTLRRVRHFSQRVIARLQRS